MLTESFIKLMERSAMAYDRPFYVQYEEDYVNDLNVRKNHDALFEIVKCSRHFHNVADFGCGSSTEFARFAKPPKYIGFDLTEAPQFDEHVHREQANYRNWDEISKWFDQVGLTGGISLFSVELFASAKENTAFYETIFANTTNAGAMLTGGIHYPDKMGQEWVAEQGEIRSRQTFSAIRPTEESESFYEFRFALPNSSKMFGECTEVFRLLFKKGKITDEDMRLVRTLQAFAGVTETDSNIPEQFLSIVKDGP